MKRTLWISLFAILAFAIILLVRLPVQWVTGLIPPGIACGQLAGTVWNGSCGELVARGARIGNITWQLRPAALLSRKVAAHVELTRGSSFARGDVEASSGSVITARNFTADMPLDRALMPQLPADLEGSVASNLALLRIENGVITRVQGQIDARDLVQGGNSQRVALGNYSLSFPAADPTTEPVGQLKSVSGPLQLEGTLRLTRAPGFVVKGLVAPSPNAPPQLVEKLRYLGSADAQGRRQFAFENTF